MSAAAKRLDAAYLEYQRRMDTASAGAAERTAAAMDLDYELDAVKGESHRWS